MWFWLSLITLLFWSGSDLFGKLGSGDGNDRTSHLKMVCAVGLVMGLHAVFSLILGEATLSFDILIRYLPISLLYIVSMAFSYMAFRYIELSISSPICNSSGAIVTILVLVTRGFGEEVSAFSLLATFFVCAGVVLLGYIDSTEDEALRKARQDESNRRYAKSKLAFVLPIVYCVLDALGTFFDSKVLETMDEDSANCAYELTFLFVGIICFIYLMIKKPKERKEEKSLKLWSFRLLGGVCETIGQFSYVYALADTEHVAFSAPIMASFCVGSIILSRIFLKEKLSKKHYVAVCIVVLGILMFGFLE